MVNFISIEQARKYNKGKSANYIKGYFDGYNNPKRSSKEVDSFLTSGKQYKASQKALEFISGKARGVIDKREGVFD